MDLQEKLFPQHILVTGGTGLIGKQLCRQLLAQGNKVTILTRRVNQSLQLFCDGIILIHSLDQIQNDEKIDVIVNLSGESISQRWSQAIKQKMFDSRIGITQKIISLIDRLDIKPTYLLSGSAVGIYGHSVMTTFTEDTPIALNVKQHNFAQFLCAEWEKTAKKAENYGVKTGLIRTGVVLSTQGGALSKLLLTFKLGLGGKIGTGNQWFSWIHIDDMINLIHLLITQKISGSVNAVAPNSVTNSEFTIALSDVLKRPAYFALPAWLIKILFAEMGKELLLEGQK